MTDLKQWDEATEHEDISVDEIDQALTSFIEARKDYDEKKKISNEADALVKEEKRKLIEILKRSGKTKWEVDGLGRASLVTSMTIKTPKDPDSKKEMLMYMRGLGEEAYFNLVSVNHRTLNSFYNQEIESNPEFRLPGIDAPVAEENIRITKSKK